MIPRYEELTEPVREELSQWHWKDWANNIQRAMYKYIREEIQSNIVFEEKRCDMGTYDRIGAYLYSNLTALPDLLYILRNWILDIPLNNNWVPIYNHENDFYVYKINKFWWIQKMQLTNKYLESIWCSYRLPLKQKQKETKWTVILTNDPEDCLPIFINNERDFNTCQRYWNREWLARWWHNILTTERFPLLMYKNEEWKVCARSTCKIVQDWLEETDKPTIYVDMTYIKSDLWWNLTDEIKEWFIKALVDLGHKVVVPKSQYWWWLSNKWFLTLQESKILSIKQITDVKMYTWYNYWSYWTRSDSTVAYCDSLFITDEDRCDIDKFNEEHWTSLKHIENTYFQKTTLKYGGKSALLYELKRCE